jgi:hypothetical protein
MRTIMQMADHNQSIVFSDLRLPGFSATDYTVSCKSRPRIHVMLASDTAVLSPLNARELAREMNGMPPAGAASGSGVVGKGWFWALIALLSGAQARLAN